MAATFENVTLDFDKLRDMDFSTLVRALRKALGLDQAGFAAQISRSVSMVSQVERGNRSFKDEELISISRLFEDSGLYRDVYKLLVKKKMMERSEEYANILKDEGKFLSEESIAVLKQEFKESGASYRDLGVLLGVSERQAKKLLSGEMALNKKQLLCIAECLQSNPEYILFVGGHQTTNMLELGQQIPELFDILELYKNGTVHRQKKIVKELRQILGDYHKETVQKIATSERVKACKAKKEE